MTFRPAKFLENRNGNSETEDKQGETRGTANRLGASPGLKCSVRSREFLPVNAIPHAGALRVNQAREIPSDFTVKLARKNNHVKKKPQDHVVIEAVKPSY